MMMMMMMMMDGYHNVMRSNEVAIIHVKLDQSNLIWEVLLNETLDLEK